MIDSRLLSKKQVDDILHWIGINLGEEQYAHPLRNHILALTEKIRALEESIREQEEVFDQVEFERKYPDFYS